MAFVLQGFKIAILVTHGFQEVEMTKPRQALEKAGALVHIISPDKDKVKAWDCDVPRVTGEFAVDVPLCEARAEDYDALFIPGGYSHPEELRLNETAITFVRGFADKPIAAICHGPALLIDAELIFHKKLTSYPAIKRDLRNAGAYWIDSAVVVDYNLITSRGPDDLELFGPAIVNFFADYYRNNFGENNMLKIEQIGKQYIDCIIHFNKERAAQLFSPDVRKVVNSNVICSNRDQLLDQMEDVIKTFGIKQVDLLESIRSVDQTTHVIRFEISYQDNTTEAVITIIRCDDTGVIREINEVFGEKGVYQWGRKL